MLIHFVTERAFSSSILLRVQDVGGERERVVVGGAEERQGCIVGVNRKDLKRREVCLWSLMWKQ